GERRNRQQLIKITRTDEGEFTEEELGAVMFVPLVGVHGWEGAEDGSEKVPPRDKPNGSRKTWPMDALAGLIADTAEPLPDFDDAEFVRRFDRFGDRRIVLLGEASHGTAEFYRARALITQRLIEKHGFTIVAVEAD